MSNGILNSALPNAGGGDYDLLASSTTGYSKSGTTIKLNYSIYNYRHIIFVDTNGVIMGTAIVPPNDANLRNIIVPCGLKATNSAAFFVHFIIDEYPLYLTLKTTLECKIPYGTSSLATVSSSIAKIYGVK